MVAKTATLYASEYLKHSEIRHTSISLETRHNLWLVTREMGPNDSRT